MNALLNSGLADWLKFERLPEGGCYKTTFQVHHLGNIFIRSLHGGVTGATMEMAAHDLTRIETDGNTELAVSSTSVDYLLITKDADLFARAAIQRLSRRLSIVDVTCWQDDESLPVARGVVILRVERNPAT